MRLPPPQRRLLLRQRHAPHSALAIQITRAMISRIPTIVQIKPCFMFIHRVE
jgi:hypothetical protein